MINIFKLGYLFVLPAILTMTSCSDDPIGLSKPQITRMATKADTTFTWVIPKDLNSGIKCSDYGKGCMNGHMAAVRKIDFVMVKFDSTQAAKEEALRIDQYYAQNWVFDDVANEPIVEKFIMETFGATRPLEELKKKQKELKQKQN